MEGQKEWIDLSGINDRTAIFSGMEWDINRIKNARILVVGAGALGNEVLKNLALLGVENIIIADFDVIEKSNLSRSVLYREEDCSGQHLKVEAASRRMKEINPSLKTLLINGDAMIDIGLGVFRRADAVISCLDNRLTRLWINRFCHWVGKPWIDGGIMDLGGQLDVFMPGESCYECKLSPQAWVNINYRNSCINRAKRYASSGLANTTPISASVIGALQVQEALKIIIDDPVKDPILKGQFYYEGRPNYFTTLAPSVLKERCKSHRRFDPIIESTELSCKTTISNTLDWLRQRFDDPEVSIELHYPLVLTMQAGNSGKIFSFIKPRPLLKQEDFSQFQESENEEVKIKTYTEVIDFAFPQPEISLQQAGVPPLHIVRVISKGDSYYVELSGDADFFLFQ